MRSYAGSLQNRTRSRRGCKRDDLTYLVSAPPQSNHSVAALSAAAFWALAEITDFCCPVPGHIPEKKSRQSKGTDAEGPIAAAGTVLGRLGMVLLGFDHGEGQQLS